MDSAEILVLQASYTNPVHAEAIGVVLNHYAEDPMGGEQPIDPELLRRLPEELARRPHAFSVLAFVGGGGTPLFLSSQSEYRPTEYLQAWVKFWWDESKRLQVAKFFQQQRCEFVREAWKEIKNLPVDPAPLIATYQQQILTARDNQQLMGFEANFSKGLYALLARHFKVKNFERKPGAGDARDAHNSYLDHGNYLAYGLAATVLWVLGIPHAMPVSHGMTRRGALVFDVADMVKDAVILPTAFMAASQKQSDQEMRNQCIAFLDQMETLPFLFKKMKAVLQAVNGDAP